jgi:hypothetical protein
MRRISNCNSWYADGIHWRFKLSVILLEFLTSKCFVVNYYPHRNVFIHIIPSKPSVLLMNFCPTEKKDFGNASLSTISGFLSIVHTDTTM